MPEFEASLNGYGTAWGLGGVGDLGSAGPTSRKYRRGSASADWFGARDGGRSMQRARRESYAQQSREPVGGCAASLSWEAAVAVNGVSDVAGKERPRTDTRGGCAACGAARARGLIPVGAQECPGAQDPRAWVGPPRTGRGVDWFWKRRSGSIPLGAGRVNAHAELSLLTGATRTAPTRGPGAGYPPAGARSGGADPLQVPKGRPNSFMVSWMSSQQAALAAGVLSNSLGWCVGTTGGPSGR